MITITVNGKPRELAGPEPLPGFLEEAGLDVRLIAVARNGVVLRREEHAATIIQPGDRLEIVHIVGGGDGGRESSLQSRKGPGVMWGSYGR